MSDRREVFKNPSRWGVFAPYGNLLWARFPTAEGPMDIYLPLSTNEEELQGLVIPGVEDCLDLFLKCRGRADALKQRRLADGEATGKQIEALRELGWLPLPTDTKE